MVTMNYSLELDCDERNFFKILTDYENFSNYLPRKLKKIDKELKRKNKTAYGGIVETRRDTMKEAILRKVIREEIKNIISEDEAFDAPIPAQIERFMKRFIDAVQGARLNRRRTTAILGRVVAAMNIDPSDLMRYVRKIKKGL